MLDRLTAQYVQKLSAALVRRRPQSEAVLKQSGLRAPSGSSRQAAKSHSCCLEHVSSRTHCQCNDDMFSCNGNITAHFQCNNDITTRFQHNSDITACFHCNDDITTDFQCHQKTLSSYTFLFSFSSPHNDSAQLYRVFYIQCICVPAYSPRPW